MNALTVSTLISLMNFSAHWLGRFAPSTSTVFSFARRCFFVVVVNRLLSARQHFGASSRCTKIFPVISFSMKLNIVERIPTPHVASLLFPSWSYLCTAKKANVGAVWTGTGWEMLAINKCQLVISMSISAFQVCLREQGNHRVEGNRWNLLTKLSTVHFPSENFRFGFRVMLRRRAIVVELLAWTLGVATCPRNNDDCWTNTPARQKESNKTNRTNKTNHQN